MNLSKKVVVVELVGGIDGIAILMND